MNRTHLLSAILVASALLAAVPAAHAGSYININGVSSTTISSSDYLDLYGSGFSYVQSVIFYNLSGCCGYGVGWGYYDDGHIVVYPGGLPTGDYRVVAYGYPDGYYDEGSVEPIHVQGPVDNDGDGYDVNSDCNDADSSIHPNAWDTPYDGIDQDCTGADSAIPDGFRDTFTASTSYYTYDTYASYDTATVGVSNGATTAFDAAYDTPEPPTSPSSYYMRADLVNTSQPAPGDQLSTSVVGPATTAEWTLHLDWYNNNQCCTMSVSWNQVWNLPKEFNAYLIDGSNVYDMKTTSQMSFYHCCYSGTKDLRVVISSDILAVTQYVPYQWSMVSVPVGSSDMSISTLFSGCVGTAYAWSSNSYQSVTTLEAGKGYWVYNSCGGLYATFIGTPIRSIDVPLQQGWNIVGAPYQGASINQTAAISHTGFIWQTNGYGGGYVETSSLNQGYGTWVYAPDATTLHIENGIATTSLALKLPALPLAQPADSKAPTFVLPFHVSDASGATDGATLEMRHDASNGFDASLDVMEAPRPAADQYTQAFFVQQGMQQDHAAVAQASKATFALDVARAGPAGQQTISWDASALPAGFVYELVDGTTRIDMTSASSHTWSAPAGASMHAMSVVVRPADAGVCVAALDGGCLAALPFDPASLL